MVDRPRLGRAALGAIAAAALALPCAVHAADRHDDRGDQHRERPQRDDDHREAPDIDYTAPPIVYQPPAYYQQPEPFPTLTLRF